jgi:biofilm PGA synthesis N-glycosyltransferase PgaC
VSDRLLLISPVRNEGENVERTVRSVLAQTRPPDLWIVVDDASDDDTLERLRALEGEAGFLRVLEAPQKRDNHDAVDRLAVAAEAIAFNWALAGAAGENFTHVAKLDGDVELPPEYYERMLSSMRADPKLGIVGGTLIEQTGGRWKRIPIPDHHVHGAVKLYTRDCFEAIGGIHERLGWDTIDETYARMYAYRTYTHRDVVARHLRPAASAGGRLRGRARHGRCAYIAGYGGLWSTLRSAKIAATASPPVASGAAFLYGYAEAAARSVSRVEDERYLEFVRAELRGRMRGALRPK